MEIPEPIRPLVAEYISQIEHDLPDLMSAFYLHGSIALDAFSRNWSDVDFITVISRRCTATDIECLTMLHQTLEAKFPDWLLEGSYLQWSDLGQVDPVTEPYPHYHDGVLNPHAMDVNLVTWWLLKNQGVALVGPDPKSLDFSLDWALLAARMMHNLNTYWVQFTRNPKRVAWLFTDYGIQWSVLGVLRQFYAFKEQSITSKIGAGKYGLETLPAKWHRLIQEALNIRYETKSSLYRFRVLRAVEALRFLRFVIYLCNTHFLLRE
jgi:hypothetical protein